MAKRNTASRSRAADSSNTVAFPDRSQNFVTEHDDKSTQPSEEEIRLRAYQRYLARGGQDGMAFDDWLEAEQELRKGVKA